MRVVFSVTLKILIGVEVGRLITGMARAGKSCSSMTINALEDFSSPFCGLAYVLCSASCA